MADLRVMDTVLNKKECINDTINLKCDKNKS